MFQYAFNKKKSSNPACYLWGLNLGKLVVLNVFEEFDLMMELVRHYNPTNRTIRNETGDIILEVTKEKMINVFGLNLNYTTKFRHANLYVVYEKRKFSFKEALLVRHRRTRERFTAKDVEPFECEEFENYFKNTYYCYNQVLA